MAPISHPHIPQSFSEPVAYVSCTCGHSHVHAVSQERPGVESVRSWLLPQISRAISQLGSHHSRPASHRAISASYGSSQLQPLYLAASWSPLQSPRITPRHRSTLASRVPPANCWCREYPRQSEASMSIGWVRHLWPFPPFSSIYRWLPVLSLVQ